MKKGFITPNKIRLYRNCGAIFIHSKKHGDFKVLFSRQSLALIRKFHWCMSVSPRQFYVRATSASGQGALLQTVLMPAPTGFFTDHRDGDTLNNRLSNLRICTRGQNRSNSKLNKNNTTGFKGIHFNRKDKKWVARISHQGRRIVLGTFLTIEQAVKERSLAEKEYHGEYARKGLSD